MSPSPFGASLSRRLISPFILNVSTSEARVIMELVLASETITMEAEASLALLEVVVLKIDVSDLAMLSAPACASGIKEITSLVPSTSSASTISSSRLMLDNTSVIISIPVGAYETIRLFFDISPLSTFWISSGFAYLRGISWVTSLSSESTGSLSNPVSISLDLASVMETIFVMASDSTIVKPFTSRTDSNTLYASLIVIFVGDRMVILPLTFESTMKFLPVSSLIYLINSTISTLLK